MKNPCPGIPGQGPFAQRGKLFDRVFVALNHLFDHLAANRASLAGSQVAVIALLQGNANLVGSFHLELFHSLLSFRDNDIVIAFHNQITPFCT